MDKSSERIKFLRRKTGLSLASFCEKVGVPFGTASNWENADRKIREQTADKIISLYQKLEIYIDKNWLMTGEGRLPKTFEEMEERLANHNASPYEEALFFYRSSSKRAIITLEDMSMSPLYKTHDILGGQEIDEKDWPSIYGNPCIINISHKNLICRILYPSNYPDKYHLVAMNAQTKEPVLVNQSIDKVYKIVFTRKPDQ